MNFPGKWKFTWNDSELCLSEIDCSHIGKTPEENIAYSAEVERRCGFRGRAGEGRRGELNEERLLISATPSAAVTDRVKV